MQFSLEQIRVLISVADKGSFSAAARQLSKAQSAVSSAIANLEVDLNVTLFDRSRREPQLTQAGRAVVAQGRVLLNQAERIQANALGLSNGEEARLSLAIEETLISSQLEDLFVTLAKKFPFLELELLTPSRADIAKLVDEGRVDIGLSIANFGDTASYSIKPFGAIHMVPVVSRQHRLASIKVDNFDLLLNERQVMHTSRWGAIYPCEQLSQYRWLVESQFALLEMVKRGIGWAWTPKHFIECFDSYSDICEVEFIDNQQATTMPVDLLIRAGYNEGKCAAWLLKELKALPYLL